MIGRKCLASALPLLCVAICACSAINPPGSEGLSSKTLPYENVELSGLILSLPLVESREPFFNLHVGLTAEITRTRTFGVDYGYAAGMIHRLDPLIKAQILSEMENFKPRPIAQLPILRQEIERKAQKIFDEHGSRMGDRGNCKVVFRVTRFYLTQPGSPRNTAFE